MKARWMAPMVLVPALFLVGCPEPEEREDIDVFEEPVAERQVDRDRDRVHVEFDLSEQRDSGIDGDVRVEGTPRSPVVVVMLENVQPGQHYPVMIHRGECDQPGQVVTELEPVMGDQRMSRTQLTAQQLPVEPNLIVLAHAPDGQPIACGELPEDWQQELRDEWDDQRDDMERRDDR